MNITVRSYLTAGVALTGASVIALSPVVAPPTSPMTLAAPTSSFEVTPLAAVNPITAWVDVFSGAADNLGGLGLAVLQDPFPLLRQALSNAIGYGVTAVTAVGGAINGAMEFLSFDNTTGLWAQLRTAATQISEGDIAGAFNTLSDGLILGPLFNIGLPVFTSGLLDIPGKIFQNAANLVKAVTNLETLFPVVLGALAPVMGSMAATGETLQAAFDSFRQGEFIDAVVTLINIPAIITGAVLNGYTKADTTFLPGLFSFDAEDPQRSGLLQALFVTLPKALAAAIAPETVPDTAGAGGPSDAAVGEGTMVAVSERRAADKDPDGAPVAPDSPAESQAEPATPSSDATDEETAEPSAATDEEAAVADDEPATVPEEEESTEEEAAPAADEDTGSADSGASSRSSSDSGRSERRNSRAA
ncbi:hypothetical protein [Mycobacterium sp. SMC-4]|uniref:hypothetical protein n=1 Tax=Mycobacterium sp. SMC-4 TaxID=2857059 RepID=UPI003D075987